MSTATPAAIPAPTPNPTGFEFDPLLANTRVVAGIPDPDVEKPFVYFRVTRNPNNPNVKKLHEELQIDEASGLPTASLLNIDLISRAWHEEHAELMANSTMQFVSTVAGFLDDQTDKLLLDEFRQLIPFFNSYKQTAPIGDLPAMQTTAKNDPKFATLLERLTQLSANIQEIQGDRAVEFHKLWFRTTTLQDIYFAPILTAHCQQAVDSIRSMGRINVSYVDLFYYLIRHVYWMSRFARLVAAGINRTRRKKYIYTKKFQLEDSQSEYTAALDAFLEFSVKEDIRAEAQLPGLLYKPTYTIESRHPAVQRELREERYANVNI